MKNNWRKAGALLLTLAFIVCLAAGCSSQPTVTLYVNSEVWNTVTVQKNAPLAAEDPALGGYTFTGWYTAEDAASAFDASAAISADTSLYAGFADKFTGELTFSPAALTEETLDAAYAVYDEYGTVETVALTDEGVLIRAAGNYGYHMDENPTVTMGVAISADGIITDIHMVDSYAQSEGFPAMITEDYLAQAYEGAYALPEMRIDAVSGASATSKAVLYAVRTAAYYAKNVLGYYADTFAEDISELSAIFPAEYSPVITDYQVDAKKVGTVLFAAEGTTADGRNIMAIKAESALSYNYDGAHKSPYDSSKPNPFVLVIVVDMDTKEVIHYHVVAEGTKQMEFFAIPQEKYDAYLGTVITAEDVYDTFTDGLVTNYDTEWEYTVDEYNRKTITGTSVIYTGATVDGTLSGQLLRNCYRTAAYFVCNYLQ